MSQELLKFNELEGEEVKGNFEIKYVNLKKIIKLLIGAAILGFIQYFLGVYGFEIFTIIANYYIFLFIAIGCVIFAIIEILNRSYATLYITNYRLVEEARSNRNRTIIIRDYHYDFFESVEIVSIRKKKKKKKPVNKISIEVVGYGKIVYYLPLKLCHKISECSRNYLINYK